MTVSREQLPSDWYRGGVPNNVQCGDDVYIDSSYAFAQCHSQLPRAVVLGRACGVYDRAAFIVGSQGRVSVGEFSCLNGVYLIAEQRITIGAHCLLAWGVVVTDQWLAADVSIGDRQHAMRRTAAAATRGLPSPAAPRPVTIEDNVWVGFDSVVLPGVTLGRGCIIGCKSVVDQDVPPHAVYVGNPGRVVRYLEADDTAETRSGIFKEHLRG